MSWQFGVYTNDRTAGTTTYTGLTNTSHTGTDWTSSTFTYHYHPLAPSEHSEANTVTFYIIECGSKYLTADRKWTYLIEEAQLFGDKKDANAAAMEMDECECTIAIYSLTRAGEL